MDDTIKLAGILAERGVDFLDVSSGGSDPSQKVKATPGAYQAPLSEAVKKELKDKMLVGAVGSITTGTLAQEILNKGQADAVLVGRYFQKNPGMILSFALGISAWELLLIVRVVV